MSSIPYTSITIPLNDDLRLLHQYRAAAFGLGANADQVERIMRRLSRPAWYIRLWRAVTR
jgi:hypothetical protein